MLAALREVHGIDVGVIRTRIDTDGRTDGEIARAILGAAGVPSDRIDALAERVRESCCRTAARLLPDDLSGAVLPGVRELLDWLDRAGRAEARLADRELRVDRAAEAGTSWYWRSISPWTGSVRL